MRRLQSDNHKKLIPLKRIAEASSYSFGYISILVQRKKLKAKKIGNKYYSTEEWFNQYLEYHARDEKRLSSEAAQELSFGQTFDKLKPASESIASVKLKTQINNLVDNLVERLDKKRFKAHVGKKTNLSAGKRAPEEKDLAEILNNKIATPEARFVADFVEPEIRLEIKWQESLNREAEDLLKQQNQEKIKQILTLQPWLLKTAVVTLVVVSAIISLAHFVPGATASFSQMAKFSNTIIPDSALATRAKTSLDNLFLNLADRTSAFSLKLENNLRRRNQVLAVRLGVLKNQALFIAGFWQGQYQENISPLLKPVANEFSGLKPALMILPAKTARLGENSLAALAGFIKGESMAETNYLAQEGTNETGPYGSPENTEVFQDSQDSKGRVAGAVEVYPSGFSPILRSGQAPISSFLDLVNTIFSRGQEVINQVKYNTVAVLENMASRQKELSLNFANKLEKFISGTDTIKFF